MSAKLKRKWSTEFVQLSGIKMEPEEKAMVDRLAAKFDVTQAEIISAAVRAYANVIGQSEQIGLLLDPAQESSDE